MENKNIVEQDQEQGLGLTEIKRYFFLCLSKWPWFVVSILLALFIAVIYIKKTPPTYQRKASVLIKDDKASSASAAGVSDLENLGLFTTSTNVNNELASFKSTSLIQEVVKRLNLTTNYYYKGFFRNDDLYGTTLPIHVRFLDLNDDAYAEVDLQLTPDKKQVKLTNFIIDEEVSSKGVEITANLLDTVSTPIGRLVISQSPYFGYYKEGEIIFVKKRKLYNAVRDYTNRVAVILNDKKNSIIDLSIADASTQRAEDVLNTLINVYNENWVVDKNRIAVSTSMFIDDRLAVIERDLGNVDNSISVFKSENMVPDLKTASDMYMSKSDEAADKLQSLNNHLYAAKYIRSSIENNIGTNQLIPANSGVENSTIEQQITEYNKVQLRRNNLVSNSSEQNPLVVDLDQSLKSMRVAVLSSLDNYIVTLEAQIIEMRKLERQTMSKISESPTQAKYLLSVERQQKVKEALYLFLLQKREENELSQAFTPYNTRIIQPPFGEKAPIAPQKMMILFVALFLGVLLPTCAIVGLDLLNTKLRGQKDLENLSIPIVGEIPSLDDGSKRKAIQNKIFNKNKVETLQIVVSQGNRNIVNEAFRLLRTNLEFITSGRGGSNVIALTSFNPGSGKSFISINLAITLAIKNHKVLVIDGDMRHGSSSAYVNSPDKGLSNYLTYKIDNISDVIIKDKSLPNLDILPVGKFPPNPAELIGDVRFSSLINELKKQYDYILIDCPPIDIVSDTLIIEQVVDRTLFVIRVGLLERVMLKKLEQFYVSKRFKNLSVIINGSKNVKGSYGYGYGYGYGYEYGSNDSGNKIDWV